MEEGGEVRFRPEDSLSGEESSCLVPSLVYVSLLVCLQFSLHLCWLQLILLPTRRDGRTDVYRETSGWHHRPPGLRNTLWEGLTGNRLKIPAAAFKTASTSRRQLDRHKSPSVSGSAIDTPSYNMKSSALVCVSSPVIKSCRKSPPSNTHAFNPGSQM